MVSCSKDYYGVLEVGRSASEAEVNGAFKRLALKWHPTKRSGDKDEAKLRFEEIGEAYSVLSDPERKAMYDQYGEDGLREWVYAGNGEEIFEKFFGTKNPFAAFNFGSEDAAFAPRLRRPGPTKMDPIVLPLDCTLEELFNGCSKKYQVVRKRPSPSSSSSGGGDDSSSFADEAKVLSIHVKPGWRAGTKITFPREGDAGPGIVPADVVFELRQARHAAFSRKGDDLHYVADLPLKAALVGTVLRVATLDGRVLSVSCPEVVAPGYVKLVKGEGMPLSSGAGRGDLHIAFRIHFPKYLSDQQKGLVTKALDLGDDRAA